MVMWLYTFGTTAASVPIAASVVIVADVAAQRALAPISAPCCIPRVTMVLTILRDLHSNGLGYFWNPMATRPQPLEAMSLYFTAEPGGGMLRQGNNKNVIDTGCIVVSVDKLQLIVLCCTVHGTIVLHQQRGEKRNN
jgi:hypothetical protein